MSPKRYTDESYEDLPSLLTIREVAAFLRIHRNKVTDLLSSGDLPHILVGRSKRIKKTDLLRYIGETGETD